MSNIILRSDQCNFYSAFDIIHLALLKQRQSSEAYEQIHNIRNAYQDAFSSQHATKTVPLFDGFERHLKISYRALDKLELYFINGKGIIEEDAWSYLISLQINHHDFETMLKKAPLSRPTISTLKTPIN